MLDLVPNRIHMKIILCLHLLVVHVELFATCSLWGEFTRPQNPLVSSLVSGLTSLSGNAQADIPGVGCLSPEEILVEKDQMLD